VKRTYRFPGFYAVMPIALICSILHLVPGGGVKVDDRASCQLWTPLLEGPVNDGLTLENRRQLNFYFTEPSSGFLCL
jgi:hypothetical protein